MLGLGLFANLPFRQHTPVTGNKLTENRVDGGSRLSVEVTLSIVYLAVRKIGLLEGWRKGKWKTRPSTKLLVKTCNFSDFFLN